MLFMRSKLTQQQIQFYQENGYFIVEDLLINKFFIAMGILFITIFFTHAAYAADVTVTNSPFNAVGNGVTNDRAAIQAAIDYVTANGGGTVNIPGAIGGRTFLSGNLTLKSNVTLNINGNATLKSSPNIADYTAPQPILGHYITPTKNPVPEWDGALLKNYPFIYSTNTSNVKITSTGAGTQGKILMTPGATDDITIHIVPIGFYLVNTFVISNITIRDARAFNISIYASTNGLVSGVNITALAEFNTDGIQIMNAQNIRVTGNSFIVADDGISVHVAYNDLRGITWWSSRVPQPSKNIEIDNNYVYSPYNAFALLPWGAGAPNLSQVEISDIQIHNNNFNSSQAAFGCYCDDPKVGEVPYTGTEDNQSPMKNIIFYGNTYNARTTSIARITNVTSDFGLISPSHFQNGDFKNKMAYWSSGGNSSQSGVSNARVGQNEASYGYIQNFNQGSAAIYQGLGLNDSTTYTFSAKVQSSGATSRMFVYNTCTNTTVASLNFNDTAWATKTLIFTTNGACNNYHIGIDNGSATGSGDWAHIDSANLVSSGTGTQTIYTTLNGGNQTGAEFNTGVGHELGTKFKANVAGTITKVRIYTGKAEGGNHSVRIWNASTSTVVSGPYTWTVTSGTAGWKEFMLPAALSITANTDYIVAVSTSTDYYYYMAVGQFNAPINNGNLITYAGSGLYNATLNSMPNASWSNNGYFRDVVFVPKN